MLARFAFALTLVLASAASRADTVTVSTNFPPLSQGLNQGWWSTVESNFDANDNYLTGAYNGGEYRSFFTFDLSNTTITSLTGASLKLMQGTMTGPVDLHLWEVSASPYLVNANNGMDGTVFNDLGGGTQYGGMHVDPSGDVHTVVIIPLNADALAALQIAPGLFTIGVTATGGNFIFGYSTGYVARLELTGEVSQVPEPSSAALLLAGLLTLAVMRRRAGATGSIRR